MKASNDLVRISGDMTLQEVADVGDLDGAGLLRVVPVLAQPLRRWMVARARMQPVLDLQPFRFDHTEVNRVT